MLRQLQLLSKLTNRPRPSYSRIVPLRSISLLSRLWHGKQATSATSETQLKEILRNQFPRATKIEVNDISGGCGAMYDITVEAPEFQGLRMVKQHQMINEALKKEIKDMHGLRIHTSVPSKDVPV